MLTRKRAVTFLRRDFAMMFSTVALALSVLGSLTPLIALSRIAHYIVDNWIFLTSVVWIYLFKLVGINIPAIFGFSLSMLLFHFGLVASARRFDHTIAQPQLDLETRTYGRDRAIAIMLYFPILLATLSTSYAALASNIIEQGNAPGALSITLSFAMVVASPITAFWLARPRQLIRRFFSVYAVIATVLLLDLLSRILDGTGMSKEIANRT